MPYINTNTLLTGEDTLRTKTSAEPLFAINEVWFKLLFINKSFDTQKIIMFNYQLSTDLLTVIDFYEFSQSILLPIR